MERLQKTIAQAGICSRRQAEELIKAGQVKVNGLVVTQMGVLVSRHDTIEVSGRPIQKEEAVYYVVNKPRRYVSTVHDEVGRPQVTDLIDCPQRIYPVGRLDYDSSGVLLMTNDGTFTNALTHPRYHVPKVYQVTFKANLSSTDLRQLAKGVRLDDGVMTAPCQVVLINRDKVHSRTMVEMTLYEGLNREIRRMGEALGAEVSKLHRTSFGPVTDKDLAEGSYRRLKPHELSVLKEMIVKPYQPQPALPKTAGRKLKKAAGPVPAAKPSSDRQPAKRKDKRADSKRFETTAGPTKTARRTDSDSHYSNRQPTRGRNYTTAASAGRPSSYSRNTTGRSSSAGSSYKNKTASQSRSYTTSVSAGRPSSNSRNTTGRPSSTGSSYKNKNASRSRSYTTSASAGRPSSNSRNKTSRTSSYAGSSYKNKTAVSRRNDSGAGQNKTGRGRFYGKAAAKGSR